MILRKLGNCLRSCQIGARAFHRHIDVHPEVQRALQRQEPVVALESTIITHGMPFPQNLETAAEVESIVRDNGATPATIAITPGGRIKVGLSAADLKVLASMPKHAVTKCSRRDLAYVVSHKGAGGTTVAATMLLAHKVGIRIFATGGVGGVHRDGHSTMDISADLVELGRTPVAVVCSGIKSILDIPRTLEYLETQGVCVATYGNSECHFPDFYTRDSGCKVPYNLRNAVEAAQLIRVQHQLALQSGILIGVSVPQEHAADKQQIDAAIEQAQQKALKSGISGKDVTPFLLAAIAEITGGRSLQANMALIKNNAYVAALIARELGRDSPHSVVLPQIQQTTPLIVGASIMDLSLRMLDDLPDTLDGATYQTHVKQSAGGVGRNLAEGIFKLHGRANLISAVGDDQLGNGLLELMPAELRQNVQTVKDKTTSLCAVLFDKVGDCKLVLGNMEIHKCITPARIRQQEHLFWSAPLIVIDGNLDLLSMEFILDLAQQHQRPVCFEPTDMRIAHKPFGLPKALREQIKIITPNLQELRTIVEAITAKRFPHELKISEPTTELLPKVKQLLQGIQQEFDCILVTLGHHGVVLCLRRYGAFGAPLFDARTGAYCSSTTGKGGEHALRFYAAPKVKDITNVSGAGDSFSSGFITGLLRGYEIDRAVALGFIAAERALQSESAVPNYYFHSESEELSALETAETFINKEDI